MPLHLDLDHLSRDRENLSQWKKSLESAALITPFAPTTAQMAPLDSPVMPPPGCPALRMLLSFTFAGLLIEYINSPLY